MKLMILDGNSVINRAYFGVRPLTTRDGLYTNAIYGFLNILEKMEREEQPEEREEAKKSPPWVDNSLSKQDRHAFFFGTMKASLLICAAYLVGFGVFILILTLLFR